MHEMSIAQSLLDAALGEFRKLRPIPQRLIKARVVVGKLRQVVPEYLIDAYTLLAESTEAEGSGLDIRTAEIVAECEACGWTGELPAEKFVCQECGESRAAIRGGTELYLDGLEVEDEN